MNTKPVISILLLISLVIPINTIAQQAQQAEIASVQQQAFLDAKNDAKKASISIWVLAGCLLHVWAIGGAYIIEPSIPTARLIGKPPEYVSFYADTYKAEVKQKRVMASFGGCCIGTGVMTTFWIILLQAGAISTLDARY